MQALELSGRQKDIVLGRLVPQVERITRSGLSEDQKLRAIGQHVAANIADLTDPLHARPNSPLDMPMPIKHDDTTIDRLARWQRFLRKSGISTAQQAEKLTVLEQMELRIQRDDRTPKKPTFFDSTDQELRVSYHFDE